MSNRTPPASSGPPPSRHLLRSVSGRHRSKRDSRRSVLGMRAGQGMGNAGKNLVNAGQKVGRFTENLGEFAAEMRKTREAIENRSKHRSPIEVVLQALTTRR